MLQLRALVVVAMINCPKVIAPQQRGQFGGIDSIIAVAIRANQFVSAAGGGAVYLYNPLF